MIYILQLNYTISVYGKILTEISEGELLDKITILEIKLNEIKNQSLIKEVQKEYEILTKIRDKNIKENKIIDDLFVELKKVNKKIWDIENIKEIVKKMEFLMKSLLMFPGMNIKPTINEQKLNQK